MDVITITITTATVPLTTTHTTTIYTTNKFIIKAMNATAATTTGRKS